MKSLVLAAALGLIAAAALAAAPATAAAIQGFEGNCHAGCPFSYDPADDEGAGPGAYFTDYTVLADGRTHVWTFRFTDAASASTLTLDDPTQVDVITGVRDAGGVDVNIGFNPLYRFDETVVPGRLLRIVSSAERDFDYCAIRTGPDGQVCSRVTEVFGKGTNLHVGGDTVIRGVFTENVPEPESWALMVAGFGVAGAALRSTERHSRESGNPSPAA
ncbi:MAG: PEPxxWA-CTERM sorting domain-containing protein [Sphingomonadaceae bacterium]|nr:PEPxxWA-CTERM sorting domain-containing protein [Sphingomonadaceae bacterium]